MDSTDFSVKTPHFGPPENDLFKGRFSPAHRDDLRVIRKLIKLRSALPSPFFDFEPEVPKITVRNYKTSFF